MMHPAKIEALYQDLHQDDYSYNDQYSFKRVSSTISEQEDNKKEQLYPLLTVQYAQFEQRLKYCWTELQVNTKRSPAKSMALLFSFAVLCCWSWSPLGRYYPEDGMLMQSHRNVRHAMKSGEYSQLEVAYNFRMDDIHTEHWCLFGTDHQCPCEDPTHGDDRHEFPAWTQPHDKNVQKVADASPNAADIVFIGDETVQSWEGMWFNRRCPQSKEIVGHWNRTFGAPDAAMKGMTLGISGDRVSFSWL